MDCFNDPKVERIVIMSSAQVGKTEIILNALGYVADKAPHGTLIIFPTLEDSRLFSRTRLTPLFRDCPVLKNKIAAAKSRDSGNTALYKEFNGGFFRLVGAGSASGLASMPLPYVFADEVDKYEPHKKEGDPLTLALVRNKMFWNRKAIITSTPSVSGESRIEKLYEQSDQRRFYVPCLHCEKEQLLMFKNLRWDKGHDKQGKKTHKPETAYYVCEHCGVVINDAEKNEMVRAGRWIAKGALNGVAGFHINEFYSPYRTFTHIAQEFLKSKDDPEKLQVFTNSVLGEVWNIPHEAMAEDELIKRGETYYKVDSKDEKERTLPQGGALLTAGVDIQNDRIEAVVRLWGKGDESWGVEYHVIWGDPYQDIVWNSLDDLLSKEYEHAAGVKLKIKCCAIDTGYATEQVYKYINTRRFPRVAVKGTGGRGDPLARNATKPDKLKVPLHLVGVDTAKNTLYQRSFIVKNGPGKMHWNQNFNKQYFEQFTAEKRIKKMRAGQEISVWEKPSGRANEALDCEVYAYAARYIAGIPNIDKLVDRLTPEYLEKKKEKDQKKSQQPRRKKGGWVNRF
jgi:phage terminase large subunit GpA-like protein